MRVGRNWSSNGEPRDDNDEDGDLVRKESPMLQTAILKLILLIIIASISTTTTTTIIIVYIFISSFKSWRHGL